MFSCSRELEVLFGIIHSYQKMSSSTFQQRRNNTWISKSLRMCRNLEYTKCMMKLSWHMEISPNDGDAWALVMLEKGKDCRRKSLISCFEHHLRSSRGWNRNCFFLISELFLHFLGYAKTQSCFVLYLMSSLSSFGVNQGYQMKLLPPWNKKTCVSYTCN